MFWIVTEAGEGGQKLRIGVGDLHEKNLGQRGVSVASRRDWVKKYLNVFGSHYPYQWQTKDDGGYLVYQGRCGDLDEADQENAFAPLDFSTADCGATYMEYRKLGETQWKIL